ncbi:MAG: hypothetical protein II453_20135 [Alphaproteobacteria bacterium]|nr:hypothetical protein [Alphaproteobacteria bacterium]
MKRNIGEEVKFQEWHYGKIVEVNGNLATIQLTEGGKVIKDVSELKTNKMLPRYIDFIFNRYRVRIKGNSIGMYETLEEAVKAKEEYLKNGKLQ